MSSRGIGGYEELCELAGKQYANRLLKEFGSVSAIETADDLSLIELAGRSFDRGLDVVTKFGSRKEKPYGLLDKHLSCYGSEDVFDFYKDKLQLLDHTEVHALFLDGCQYFNEIIASKRVGRGDADSVNFDTRLLQHLILQIKPRGVILCYNNPTGDLRKCFTNKDGIAEIARHVEGVRSYLTDIVGIAGRGESFDARKNDTDWEFASYAYPQQYAMGFFTSNASLRYNQSREID